MSDATQGPNTIVLPPGHRLRATTRLGACCRAHLLWPTTQAPERRSTTPRTTNRSFVAHTARFGERLTCARLLRVRMWMHNAAQSLHLAAVSRPRTIDIYRIPPSNTFCIRTSASCAWRTFLVVVVVSLPTGGFMVPSAIEKAGFSIALGMLYWWGAPHPSPPL